MIAVLDANQGAIAGQAAFYVELTRARDNAVLLTDDRDGLVEALETAAGDELSALEAIGHQFREPEPEVAVAEKESVSPEILRDAKIWQEEIHATLERHVDRRLAEREALLDRARQPHMDGIPALADVEGHAEWRGRALAAVGACREHNEGFAGKADLLEKLVAFDDDLAEFDRDRQRHAQAARAAGEDFALHPGIEDLIARGRALVETAPRPEEIPWDLPPYLDVVTSTRREHDEEVARAEAEILARLDRAERELDAVKDARRALRDLAQGEPLHAVAGYGEWRKRAEAANDALQSAVVRDGEREQRGLDDTLRLSEAFGHDDDVAALIADWTAFEDEARARGVEAVDLAASDPLLARIHHLAGNPPEGETPLRALTGILARRQARSEEREKAAATITRSLDGYRACHRDTASSLSAIAEWRAGTRAAIETWRAMTISDERDPALLATVIVLEDLIAFEERARDVLTRWRIASIGKDAAQRFLGPEGESLAADLKALEAGLPRHAIMLHDLRPALEQLAEHERAADQARELLARAREVDDARRSLLEHEGKSSRPLDRRFNRAWRRWREAAEAVMADIEATDAALIAHVDDTAVASRVMNAYAASDRLDSLPGWLLLRLHDNAANAGSAMHPAMTQAYAGIVSDMQRLDAGLKRNDPRRVVLRGEINAYQALDQTRRTVARLLADLKAHDADTASLDAQASREDLPLQQSLAWARWYNQSRRLEDQARKVLSGGDRNLRVVLHDGEGTRQAFEETLARFEQTRAAHGEPDNSARLERMRQEDEERRRAWSQRRGRGLSM